MEVRDVSRYILRMWKVKFETGGIDASKETTH